MHRPGLDTVPARLSLDPVQFDRYAESLRHPFIAFLASVSPRDGESGATRAMDWWVSGPASRHSLLSSLFPRLVRAVMARDAMAKGTGPQRVVVDSRALAGVVRRIAHADDVRVDIVHDTPPGRRAINRCRALLSPARSVARILFDWIVIRCLVPRPATEPGRDYVLLDTFALPGHPGSDRYYPGLFDFLSESQRTGIRLVPQFHGFGPAGTLRAAWRLRGEQAYLFKESVLGLRDVAWAAAYVVRVYGIRVRAANFDGIDVAALVNEDLRDPKSFRCAIQGLLNYRFARALRRRGIGVRLAVDWFENHPMDRGWNAGFRDHFPQAVLKGYQGFYPSFPAARPAPFESAAGVLPDRLVTIGEAMADDLREFDPGLAVEVGPAFRYRDIKRLGPVEARYARHVLVVLPYDRLARDHMLDLLAEDDAGLASFDVSLKPHPATGRDGIARMAALRLPRSRLCEQSLPRALATSAVVVGGPVATSSLEVIAMGRPYVSIAVPGLADEHVPPRGLPYDAMKRVSSADELGSALRSFCDAGAGNAPRIAEQVRRRYFSGVDRQAVERFLEL